MMHERSSIGQGLGRRHNKHRIHLSEFLLYPAALVLERALAPDELFVLDVLRACLPHRGVNVVSNAPAPSQPQRHEEGAQIDEILTLCTACSFIRAMRTRCSSNCACTKRS